MFIYNVKIYLENSLFVRDTEKQRARNKIPRCNGILLFFEPETPAIEWPKTCALDSMATVTDLVNISAPELYFSKFCICIQVYKM